LTFDKGIPGCLGFFRWGSISFEKIRVGSSWRMLSPSTAGALAGQWPGLVW
jgi:hypothetical protein